MNNFLDVLIKIIKFSFLFIRLSNCLCGSSPCYCSYFLNIHTFSLPCEQVNAGLECGLGLEDYDEWEEGDIIEAFNTVEKRRTLEEASASMAAAVEGVGG